VNGEIMIEGVWQDRFAKTDTFRLSTKEANVYFDKGASQIPPGPGSKKAHKQCACNVENGNVLLTPASGKKECKRCHDTCKMCSGIAFNECTTCKPLTGYPKALSMNLVSGICKIGCESSSYPVLDPKTPGLSQCKGCHKSCSQCSGGKAIDCDKNHCNTPEYEWDESSTRCKKVCEPSHYYD
jgi:hypothetical protein